MSYTCKFYGGATGSIISKVWGRNIAITETDVNNYSLANYLPSWTDETYALIKFENNLDAGNVPSSIGIIQDWTLYRETIGEDALELIGVLEDNISEYYDFTAIYELVYRYYLFAQGTTEMSNPISTNSIQSDYYGWYLIDPENNRAYHFDMDFSGGDKSFIEDYTEYETNNKNNIFTRGGNFYKEGTLESIISKDNLKIDIIDTNDDLLSLSEFIHSTRPKILKGRRNEIFKVLTYGYKEILLNKDLGESIYKVSFNFKEVGDV